MEEAQRQLLDGINHNNFQLVQQAILNGADTNSLEMFGIDRPPLVHAMTLDNDIEIITLLLDNNANPNQDYINADGETIDAMYIALVRSPNPLNYVEAIVNHGANLTKEYTTGFFGNEPLLPYEIAAIIARSARGFNYLLPMLEPPPDYYTARRAYLHLLESDRAHVQQLTNLGLPEPEQNAQERVLNDEWWGRAIAENIEPVSGAEILRNRQIEREKRERERRREWEREAEERKREREGKWEDNDQKRRKNGGGKSRKTKKKNRSKKTKRNRRPNK